MLIGPHTEMSLKAIVHSGWLKTQGRVTTPEPRIQQFIEDIKAGDQFPEPVVFQDEKTGNYWVGDGFTRLSARHRMGDKVVVVDLRLGTERDAFLYNIEANKKYKGLPFSRQDKEKCIEKIIKENSGWSGPRIAALLGCSGRYVTEARSRLGFELPEKVLATNGRMMRTSTTFCKQKVSVEEVKAKLIKGLSQKQAAKELGVSPSAISSRIRNVKRVRCGLCGGRGWVVGGPFAPE
jgi:Helix-turn-helix